MTPFVVRRQGDDWHIDGPDVVILIEAAAVKPEDLNNIRAGKTPAEFLDDLLRGQNLQLSDLSFDPPEIEGEFAAEFGPAR